MLPFRTCVHARTCTYAVPVCCYAHMYVCSVDHALQKLCFYPACLGSCLKIAHPRCSTTLASAVPQQAVLVARPHAVQGQHLVWLAVGSGAIRCRAAGLRAGARRAQHASRRPHASWRCGVAPLGRAARTGGSGESTVPGGEAKEELCLGFCTAGLWTAVRCCCGPRRLPAAHCTQLAEAQQQLLRLLLCP